MKSSCIKNGEKFYSVFKIIINGRPINDLNNLNTAAKQIKNQSKKVTDYGLKSAQRI